MGCETCTNETQYACLTCSEGFFLLDNACWNGCPPEMYTNTDTRVCQECHPDCMTCSQPNAYSCTACAPGYYLLDGTCVTACPTTHYYGLLGELGVAQIPACVPKIVLSFSLHLATNSRVINIKFNYGIIYHILAISQRIQVEIANTQISPAFFVLSPLTESSIKFQYLGDQYYPPNSLLRITIDLDSDFNNDLYSRFLIYEKTQTIELKEIYPFTKTEAQFISSTSELTSSGGSTIAAVQAVSTASQGAVSMGLIRLQMVGDIVQLMRFIDIRWPPNVVNYFETSHIDPNSMVIPFDFMPAWNEQLEDRNYSMPRIFESYETSPFITMNYNNEISNLIVWAAVAIIGVLLIVILKKVLRNLTERMPIPKTNAHGKCKYSYIRTIHKIVRFMNRREESTLWSLFLMFVLSIFMPGNMWALLNIRYSSTLNEPSTVYTSATLAIAIVFLCFYPLLGILITMVLWRQLQYLLNVKESLRPSHLKKYRCLFEDFECQKRIQILYVPISLARSLIMVMTVSLLCSYGSVQIILLWTTDLAFIVYLIVYHPLKERWVRRITLVIELLVFGCISMGFIFNFLDGVDAVTLDELGFAFLALSMASTFAGILISLLQVLEIVKQVYGFLKEKIKNRRNEVYPISLMDQLPAREIKTPDHQELKSSDKEVKFNHKKNRTMKTHPMKNASRYKILIKEIEDIPPDVFDETIDGEEYLDNLEDWVKSLHAKMKNRAKDSTEEIAEGRKHAGSTNRISIISSDL